MRESFRGSPYATQCCIHEDTYSHGCHKGTRKGHSSHETSRAAPAPSDLLKLKFRMRLNEDLGIGRAPGRLRVLMYTTPGRELPWIRCRPSALSRASKDRNGYAWPLHVYRQSEARMRARSLQLV